MYVVLTKKQSEVFHKAAVNNSGAEIELSKKQVKDASHEPREGAVLLPLTRAQHREIAQKKKSGEGMKIHYKAAAIKKLVKSGGILPLIMAALQALGLGSVLGMGKGLTNFGEGGSGLTNFGSGLENFGENVGEGLYNFGEAPQRQSSKKK